MKVKNDINFLINNDELIKIKQLNYSIDEKYKLHIQHNQQQRCICDSMILIALAYGIKKRSYQDLTYTLIDKCLIGTMYEKHLSKLRGLTIVGNWYSSNTFFLITCFWNYKIKLRKRY